MKLGLEIKSDTDPTPTAVFIEGVRIPLDKTPKDMRCSDSEAKNLIAKMVEFLEKNPIPYGKGEGDWSECRFGDEQFNELFMPILDWTIQRHRANARPKTNKEQYILKHLCGEKENYYKRHFAELNEIIKGATFTLDEIISLHEHLHTIVRLYYGEDQKDLFDSGILLTVFRKMHNAIA